MKDLEMKYRMVLRMRELGYTLEDVGEILQVTRERVRQIEAKAKEIIRCNRTVCPTCGRPPLL